ncbi:MAG: prephenate dehydrogenase/arogenate dehydrogenase family protein [Pirellulales bacterium]|nr:prephenate dehydrogenase/arogenate dehydrogenase family protein [Pirellulales bacterium]
MQTHWDTVAIVGVGLMGGSIGLALRGRGLAREVVGIGRRAASLRVARRMGAVTRTSLDVARGVADAELVVVCTPVDRIVADIERVAASCRPDALVTDVGSTKGSIVRGVAGLKLPIRYVGSHPLAGSERNGPAAATADLLVGRVVVVTPTRETPTRDRRELGRFWRALGARVVEMGAEEHDACVAAISHLPHVAAAALAGSTPAGAMPLAAQGWRDTTRVAAGDAHLWREILLDNRRNVLPRLDVYLQRLQAFQRALAEADATALERLLREGKRRRDAVGS